MDIRPPHLGPSVMLKLGGSLLILLVLTQHILAHLSPAVPPPHCWSQPWDPFLPLGSGKIKLQLTVLSSMCEASSQELCNVFLLPSFAFQASFLKLSL